MTLESKRIATLLLRQPNEAAWTYAIEIENILQKDTITTARRQANLIRARLTTLDLSGWQLIVQSESEIVQQLLLAAALKQNKLLSDFMCNVYISRQKKIESCILPSNWDEFLIECAHLDSSVSGWSPSTKAKIFSHIGRILVEAKYLVDQKSMQLSPRSLHPVVRRYLSERHEKFILDCLERAT